MVVTIGGWVGLLLGLLVGMFAGLLTGVTVSDAWWRKNVNKVKPFIFNETIEGEEEHVKHVHLSQKIKR